MALSEAQGRTMTFTSPFVLTLSDGSRKTTEMTATYYDDWKETPFGPVNFGYAVFGPTMWVTTGRAALGAGDDT